MQSSKFPELFLTSGFLRLTTHFISFPQLNLFDKYIHSCKIHNINYTLTQFHPIYLQDSSYYHVFANSIDPDQLASQKPADQDQHCLVLIILTSQVGCGELHMFVT